MSGVASGLTSNLLSDPHKIETVLGLVRTAAPLTSTQTVSKINTYLPIVEKLSTLYGMYLFLNRAQNFTPIQSLNAKTPMEKVTALITNGNIPVAKILAQPLISNNMDKIISSVAKNVIGSNLSGVGLDKIIGAMSKELLENKNGENNSSSDGFDIGGLIDTFMPLINSMNVKSKNEEAVEHNDKPHKIKEYENNDIIGNVNNIDNIDIVGNIGNISGNDDIEDSLTQSASVHKVPTKEHNTTINSNIPIEIKPRSRRTKYY